MDLLNTYFGQDQWLEMVGFGISACFNHEVVPTSRIQLTCLFPQRDITAQRREFQSVSDLRPRPAQWLLGYVHGERLPFGG